MNKVEINGTTFITNFYRDSLFRTKFFYQVNRCMQQFISSLSNVYDVEDVDFDLINLSHIHISVIIQNNSATSPSLFKETQDPITTVNMVLTQN